MTKEQFDEITDWQDKTFPISSEVSRINHLIKEVQELKSEAKKGINGLDIAKKMEYADCFFLLFGAAKKAGYSYEEICEFIQNKFIINKHRVWGKPDKDGVVQHIIK